jgi:hypothetical protein
VNVHNSPMNVEVKTMQFGQPYSIGQDTLIAEQDGVNLSVSLDGMTVMNLALTPEKAFEIARLLSESAHRAHANAIRNSGERVTLASILALGRKRL